MEVFDIFNTRLGVVSDRNVRKLILASSIKNPLERILDRQTWNIPVSTLHAASKHVMRILGMEMTAQGEPQLHSDKLWYTELYGDTPLRITRYYLRTDERTIQQMMRHRAEVILDDPLIGRERTIKPIREMYP